MLNRVGKHNVAWVASFRLLQEIWSWCQIQMRVLRKRRARAVIEQPNASLFSGGVVEEDVCGPALPDADEYHVRGLTD